MYSVGELFFALNNLHATMFIYGLVGSTFAAGALLAAVFNERREVSQERLPANIIAGALLAGFGVFLTGLSWHWALLFPTAALAGIGVSTLNAYFFALMLQRAPDASRGRVASAVQGVTSAGQIASFAIGGIVVSAVNPRIAILISGIACLVTTGAFTSTVLGATKRNPIYEVEPILPVIDFPVVEPE